MEHSRDSRNPVHSFNLLPVSYLAMAEPSLKWGGPNPRTSFSSPASHIL